MDKNSSEMTNALAQIEWRHTIANQPTCPVCGQPFVDDDMDTVRVLQDDDDTIVHDRCFKETAIPTPPVPIGWQALALDTLGEFNRIIDELEKSTNARQLKGKPEGDGFILD